MVILFGISLLLASCRDKDTFDPWGGWNQHTVPYIEDDIQIKMVDKKEYYEIARSGVFLIKNGKEKIKNMKKNSPIVAIEGEYTQIEKYEPIEDGFIFYLVGDGFKSTPEGPQFRDNTHIQVKMHFVNEDECYFKYVSLNDENGFHLSYFPNENVTYKRLRVGAVPRPVALTEGKWDD
jgi:hypothetical protein